MELYILQAIVDIVKWCVIMAWVIGCFGLAAWLIVKWLFAKA